MVRDIIIHRTDSAAERAATLTSHMTVSVQRRSRVQGRYLNSYQDRVGIHLQWFASEDEGRSLDPTERKIREARQEGRVAKSIEIPSTLVMLTCVGILWGFRGYYVESFQQLLQFYLYRATQVDSTGMSADVLQIAVFILRLTLPVLLAVFFIAIVGNVLQFGFLFSPKAIVPKWSKINVSLSKWLEKSVSKQGWYVLGTALFKIFLIAAVLYGNFRIRFNEFIGFFSHSFDQNLGYISRLVFLIVFQGGLLMLLFSILDFRFQTYIFKDQLKMSREELKKEFRESEGDPEVRRRIRSRMQEYLNRNIPEQVSQSDVVVTNPTHFAVAMKYDMQEMEAPQIMAKGSDLIARRIRTLAEENDVPIIENKALARALYHELNVGDYIPEKYFRAVVMVFKEVYKLKGVQVNE